MARATVVFRSVGTEVARMCGSSETMTLMCEPLLATARGLAARHNVTGSYESHFGVDRIPGRKGVTDRAVYNDDPQAHIIEDGHLQYGKTPDGTITVRFVEGLHILRRTAQIRV